MKKQTKDQQDAKRVFVFLHFKLETSIGIVFLWCLLIHEHTHTHIADI